MAEIRTRYNAKELIEADLPPVKWYIKHLLPMQGITLIGGDVGSFKTFFTLYMSVLGSLGKKIINKFDTEPFSVLYIDEENRPVTMKDRMEKLCIGLDINPDDLGINFIFCENFILNRKIGETDKLKETIDKYKPDVVVCDSLIRMMMGDENSSQEVKRFYSRIKPFLDETSWILIHHTKKTWSNKKTKDDIRGSGDFSAFSDVVLMINREGQNGSQKFSLTQVKNRLEPILKDKYGFEVYDKLCSDKTGIAIYPIDIPQDKSKSELASDDIKDMIVDKVLIGEFKTEKIYEIFKDSKHGKNALLEGLKILAKEGKYLEWISKKKPFIWGCKKDI